MSINLRQLLCKINKVTSKCRHGLEVPERALNELCNYQIEFEKDLREIEDEMPGIANDVKRIVSLSYSDDVEKTYEEFWKDIVEKDGQLNKEAIKRELYDFSSVLREVARTYDHITRGRISKPNTCADHVILLVEEIINEEIEEVIKEDEENKRNMV